MRYSSFSGRKLHGLKGLGDVACERNLLQRLAAQFFYNLPSADTSTAGTLAAPFLYAYLGSTGYSNNPVFPDGAGLLFLLQSYMAEFLGASSEVDTLLAISTPTLENLTEWSRRATIPVVPSMTRVQAEAAMLLCQTPAVDPAASAAAATATAERARRDAETARSAATAAASSASGASATAEERAEAAIAAAAAAVAAQFAAEAAATATAAVAATAPSTTSPSWSTLTPAQRAALWATRPSVVGAGAGAGGGGGGGTSVESTATSYLPYVVGGGLLLAAAVVFSSKSAKRAAPGPVSA